MKKILFLVIVSTLLALSCKKNKTQLTHHIEGVTLDSRAIAYPEVANVSLLLEEKKLEGGVYNGSFVELATTTSDEFGRYEFRFDKRNTLEYRLTASKENFFPHQEALNPELVRPGLTYDKNVNLVPQAWLQKELVNDNPIDENDEITFKFLNAGFNCDCCTNEAITFTGTNVDETSMCMVYGNTWIKYYTIVNRTGTPAITTIDSIFCHSFDTTNVVINY